MKINWGTGIAIFYTLFVIVMVGMVIKSTYHKADLVQEDYYNKDLNYEDFRQKRQNASNLNISVDIETISGNRTMVLNFPSQMNNAKGQITLFRPSNKYLDRTMVIKLDQEGIMEIPLENSITAGLWKVQMEWESNQIAYYKEEQIII